MRKLLIIIVFAALISCGKDNLLCPAVPKANPTPDETSVYEDPSSGYKSVAYIYYCLNGKYQIITWTRTERCGNWNESIFTSPCKK